MASVFVYVRIYSLLCITLNTWEIKINSPRFNALPPVVCKDIENK